MSSARLIYSGPGRIHPHGITGSECADWQSLPDGFRRDEHEMRLRVTPRNAAGPRSIPAPINCRALHDIAPLSQAISQRLWHSRSADRRENKPTPCPSVHNACVHDYADADREKAFARKLLSQALHVIETPQCRLLRIAAML